MESSKGISGSNLTNYIRLQYLLNTTSTGILRETFRENWKVLYQTKWENSSENGAEFIQSQAGKALYNRGGSIQKQLLKSGDLGKWDLPLLIDSLETLDKKKPKNNLQNLKKIRNQIAHHGSMSVEDAEFEEMWKTISEALQTYGVSQDELDEIKKIQIGQLNSEQNSKKESHLNEANMAKAEELKTSGNQLFQNKKYDEAIEVYSEAIRLSGIPSNDLAVLYSNRSISYLILGDPKTAKEDAKGAVHLRPSWWRAYHRLARAYEALEKLDVALKHYEIAHGLEPTNIHVKDDVDNCRLRVIKRREDEHLDPMHFVQSFEDLALQMNSEYGTSLNADVLQRLQKEIGGLDGICEEGDNYRFGRGVKQDYAAAARLYTKATRSGSARGIYSLALLTVEGQGVNRNVAEAIRLLKEAAAQEPTRTLVNGFKVPNFGVAEAEHALGHSHEEGIHVRQDIKKAIYWYERAIIHGSGDAANNVGLLYSKGKGVREDSSKAIEYYKLSAFMKVVRAMESLAHIHLKLGDLVNAQKWHAFAIAKRSASLKIEFLEKFKQKLGNDLNKPLDVDTFQRQFEDEVKKGPLKHLISEDSIHSVMEKVLAQRGLKTSNSSRNATSRNIHGLTDPYRVTIIKLHRKNIKLMNTGTLGMHDIKVVPPSLKQKSDVDLTNLKPICFEDMKTDKDFIYHGFVLKLTLIEDAYLGTPSVGLIGEDKNGDIQRIFIYHFKQDKDTQNTLGFGCQISILNPYFRLTDDGLPAIRVDDVSLVWYHPNLKNTSLCRYCFKENSTLMCRKCMRVVYCSRDCQDKDSSLLSHDLMCKKRLWYPK